MTPRLKTSIAVSALLRRAEIGGAFAAILRRGDDVAGAYMVCVRDLKNNEGGAMTLYTSERNMNGDLVWFTKGPMTDAEAMTIINRRVDLDPDLWVVEIEDGKGRNFLEEASSPKPSDAQVAAEALFPSRSPRR